MAKTKTYSRTKVVIDDQFERFVENERFSGVSLSYNAEEKKFDVVIPKERKRSDEGPDKIAEGEKTSMYFSKRKSGGYGFQLTVNTALFKAIGKKVIVEEFEKCVDRLFEELG